MIPVSPHLQHLQGAEDYLRKKLHEHAAFWKSRNVHWKLAAEHEFYIEPLPDAQCSPDVLNNRRFLLNEIQQQRKIFSTPLPGERKGAAQDLADALGQFDFRTLIMREIYEDRRLYGIIDRRYAADGAKGHGQGYYDGGAISEMRVSITDDPLRYEQNYHTMMEVIQEVSARYGCALTHYGTHYNFSAEGIERHFLLEGIAKATSECGMLVANYSNGTMNQLDGYITQVSVGPSRAHMIRDGVKNPEHRAGYHDMLIMANVLMGGGRLAYSDQRQAFQVGDIHPVEYKPVPVVDENCPEECHYAKRMVQGATIAPNGALVFSSEYYRYRGFKVISDVLGAADGYGNERTHIDPKHLEGYFENKVFLVREQNRGKVTYKLEVDKSIPEPIARRFTQLTLPTNEQGECWYWAGTMEPYPIRHGALFLDDNIANFRSSSTARLVLGDEYVEWAADRSAKLPRPHLSQDQLVARNIFVNDAYPELRNAAYSTRPNHEYVRDIMGAFQAHATEWHGTSVGAVAQELRLMLDNLIQHPPPINGHFQSEQQQEFIACTRELSQELGRSYASPPLFRPPPRNQGRRQAPFPPVPPLPDDPNRNGGFFNR